MNTKTYTILIFALLAALLSGCEAVQDALNLQKPTASLKGLKLDNINLQSATLLFDVELSNPYPVPLPLSNIDYNVTSSTNNLFSGKADLQTTIPAKESTTVSLPAEINYLDIVKAFKGIRPGSKIPYNADVGLSVDTPALGMLRLPLNKTGQLSVPAVPNIDEIDWKKVLDQVGQL
jgi:LEA14-like dessication related protein